MPSDHQIDRGVVEPPQDRFGVRRRRDVVGAGEAEKQKEARGVDRHREPVADGASQRDLLEQHGEADHARDDRDRVHRRVGDDLAVAILPAVFGESGVDKGQLRTVASKSCRANVSDASRFLRPAPTEPHSRNEGAPLPSCGGSQRTGSRPNAGKKGAGSSPLWAAQPIPSLSAIRGSRTQRVLAEAPQTPGIFLTSEGPCSMFVLIKQGEQVPCPIAPKPPRSPSLTIR